MKVYVFVAILLGCLFSVAACGDAPQPTKISMGQIEQAATGALAAIPTAEPTPTPRPTVTPVPTRPPTATPVPTLTPTPVVTPTVVPVVTPIITPTTTTIISVTAPPVVTPTIVVTTAPATTRAPEAASTGASAPCRDGQIKGNLNSMIYHVPGQRYYAQTKNNVQCFDREADAVTAGFRKSKV
jgi:hypothetical protein